MLLVIVILLALILLILIGDQLELVIWTLVGWTAIIGIIAFVALACVLLVLVISSHT